MIVGIDFSIRSPGITIEDTNGCLNFYIFPRIGRIKEDCLHSLEKAFVQITMLNAEVALPGKPTIGEKERSSLLDAITEIRAIANVISTNSSSGKLNEKDHVAIEGFSFGSTGNRLAQISGYQWLLRYVLHQELGLPINNLHIYSPMTVKATAGKGNYKKHEMIQSFIDSVDLDLQQTTLWKTLKENSSQFQTKKGNWLSPIDDICDSYWVLKTLKKALEL